MSDQRLVSSSFFNYQNGELHCESSALSQIAQSFGTPSYVYSLAELRGNACAFLDAARTLEGDSLICYALKANGNRELLHILSGMGLGADIVSGGELFLALKSGFEAPRIVFSGVGKTRQEIAEAISAGILALHVESQDELSLIKEVAGSLGRIAPVAVRVNPDIKVDTHAHVATGQKTHKFGVAPDLGLAMMREAKRDQWLRPVGLSAHLGSQIASLEPFDSVAEKLGEMADALSVDGLQLDYLDIGGGLAIDYGGSGAIPQATRPSIADWLAQSAPAITRRGYRLLVEPGRSIIGSAGLLLTRVLYTKVQGGRHVIITDAGMTDLIRPALYGAHHPVVPVLDDGQDREELVDIAGPICETSDFLARDRLLPALKPGDLLAILQTGAYGYAMTSNYNGRQRPAEVLVQGDHVRVIRRRESYEALLRDYPSD